MPIRLTQKSDRGRTAGMDERKFPTTLLAFQRAFPDEAAPGLVLGRLARGILRKADRHSINHLFCHSAMYPRLQKKRDLYTCQTHYSLVHLAHES